MGRAWAQGEGVGMLMPQVFVRGITFLGMRGVLRFV